MKPIRKVNNRMKGAYGMTTLQSGKRPIIEINKRAHAKLKNDKRFSKKEKTLLNTIVHEEIHAKHQRMYEKNVRRMAIKKTASMSKVAKKKFYSRYA